MTEQYIYYINGQFVSSKDAVVSFDDGGFQRGNALFETIRFHKQHLFSINNHIERLRKGINYLGFKVDKTDSELISLLFKTIQKNSLESGVIKLMITNNFDMNNPFDSKLNIYISVRPIKKITHELVKIIFLNEWDFPIMRFKNSIKINSYAGNIKALMLAKKSGAFDAVFLNRDKMITEATMRNIFFIKNNIILTPPLSLGILPGTTRALILNLCQELGYDYSEKLIKFDDINNMDEAFLTSSSYGVIPCYWDHWVNKNIKVKELKKALDNRLSKK
tara:strand:+ start:546 stop:1376 length:831 start_codon:yes stop_codon:yes gene_type:complete